MDMVTRVQTLDEAVFILHSTNTIGECMNSIILSSAMVDLALHPSSSEFQSVKLCSEFSRMFGRWSYIFCALVYFKTYLNQTPSNRLNVAESEHFQFLNFFSIDLKRNSISKKNLHSPFDWCFSSSSTKGKQIGILTLPGSKRRY